MKPIGNRFLHNFFGANRELWKAIAYVTETTTLVCSGTLLGCIGAVRDRLGEREDQ